MTVMVFNCQDRYREALDMSRDSSTGMYSSSPSHGSTQSRAARSNGGALDWGKVLGTRLLVKVSAAKPKRVV